MNISFFIFSLRGGGAERITSHLANHWATQSNRVTVITMTGNDDGSYPLSKDITLIKLNVDRPSGNIFSAIKNNLVRVRSLRAALRKTQTNVLIAMMPEANITAALACIHLDTICIGSERAYPPLDPIGTVWTLLRKQTYRLLDTIVAQTQQSEKWIKQHTSARKTIVIPNPVVFPIPSFKPILEPKIHPDRKFILAAGRLTKIKQFDHLITAFSSIAQSHSQYDLIILGEGVERTALERQIEKLGFMDRIFLPGRAGNMGDWFANADMYVLTSKSEGFPNTLLEAMSHGLPCISYECPAGPAEIIQHGYNGILVPADNVTELSARIDGLISDVQLQHQLSSNALQIRERYGLDNVMKIWDQLIESPN